MSEFGGQQATRLGSISIATAQIETSRLLESILDQALNENPAVDDWRRASNG